MRIPGIVRKVDSLGRIVIPNELRKALDIHSGDLLELGCDGETLTLRKFSLKCIFCGSGAELSLYKEKYVCSQCLQTIKRG